MSGNPVSPLDPVTTEIIRNAFVSAANEMSANLVRAAFSPIIYEMKDCSVGLFNENVEFLGQSPGLPVFLGNLGAGIEVTTARIRLEGYRPGDVFMVNDPYLTGTHLNDVTIFSPIFYGGRLVGFAAGIAHLNDIGAKDAGQAMDATEIYQEGLRLGPVRIVAGGQPQHDVLDIITRNSRLPRAIYGDIQAMIAACRTGEKRFAEILDKFGLDAVRVAEKAIFEQCERLDREAVEAIPDGVYEAEGCLDNDGQTDDPVPVKVKVTVRGTEMEIDLTGSSPQTRGCLNCGEPATISAARLAFKFLINPDVPTTGGTFRPLRLVIPKGSVFAAEEPAACQYYYPHLGLMIDLIILALAPAMPDRVAAGQCADAMNVLLTGSNPITGQPFVSGEATGVGWGAFAGGDGENGMINYGGGDLKNFPIEVLESRYPIKIRRYGLVPDSGGPGRFRGGLGIVREYEVLSDDTFLSLWFERTRTPGRGIFGGKDGRVGRVLVGVGSPDERVILKINKLPVARGTIIRAETGGGGGYDDPAERDRNLVREDILDGYVTEVGADRDYGYTSKQN